MLFPVWFPHTTLCHKVTNPLLKSTASRIQFEIHTSLDLQCNSVVAPFFVARLAKHEQCFFAHRLFFAVADMGENWSVGQKQLLCFGRVILKRSRILFMDETTTDAASRGSSARNSPNVLSSALHIGYRLLWTAIEFWCWTQVALCTDHPAFPLFSEDC